MIKSNNSEYGVQTLVNSFYKCVNNYPNAKIVFRTFGTDGWKVYDEFNLFLSGKIAHQITH